MENLKQTPLLPLQSGGRTVPFAGWEMPVSFDGILEEHRRVRQSAGLFDVSHMGEFSVRGPEAEKYLNHLLPNQVGGLPVGNALYSPMCLPSGGTIDDLIVYRTGELEFLVVVNAGNRAKDFAWMSEQTAGYDLALQDVSDNWALLALQGPAAPHWLQNTTGWQGKVPQARFSLTPARFGNEQGWISRTGYTGEDGFELFVPIAQAVEFASRLLEARPDPNSPGWIGLGARDSLRLEAGYPLYGHELSEDISPLEAGLGWTVPRNKNTDYIGRQALEAQRQAGIPRKVKYFVLSDRRIARPGCGIFADGRSVGQVLSGSMSPILEKPIGSLIVDSGVDFSSLEVDIRGTKLPISIQKPPLHKSS